MKTDILNIQVFGKEAIPNGQSKMAKTDINMFDEVNQDFYYDSTLFVDIDTVNSTGLGEVNIYIHVFSPGAWYKVSNNTASMRKLLYSFDMSSLVEGIVLPFGGHASVLQGSVFNNYIIEIENNAGSASSLIVKSSWITLKK